jgi:hypothetical protein
MFKRLLPVLLASCVPLLLAAPALAELRLERFAIGAQNENGTPDLQAGSHPYALTTTFLLNAPGPTNGFLKDVRAELPPGFVGDPNATPKCSYQEFIDGSSGAPAGAKTCSNETAVGIATTYFLNEAGVPGIEAASETNPVYNLAPSAGVAAEFGFIVAERTPVFLDTSVRTGSDYGLTTAVSNVSQGLIIGASKVTIWGVPADPSHNLIRGTCLRSYSLGEKFLEDPEPGSGLREGEDEQEGPVGSYHAFEPQVLVEPTEASEATKGCASQAPQAPLLTNPTSCNAPRTATLSIDSWEEPGNFSGERSETASLPELTGCEKLNFAPTISVKPDGEAASTPTGLNVNLRVPQEATENPAGDAEADVKDTTVTLPAGVDISPSAADGLQACSNAQVGFERYEELDRSGTQSMIFKPKVYNPTTGQEEATLCPDASKIANVRIKTPLLEGELEGSVFLAAPQNFAGLPENPFSSLVAMYLVAEEPQAGVLIKLAGKVSPDPVTGQLTTTFENTPQLPFSDLKLEFYGTDRAPLATPARCGQYGTTAAFTPWTSSEQRVVVSKPFEINSGPVLQSASGPQATPCPGSALPFSPTLTSGTTNNNAGSFSPLTTTLSREDGQQSIQSVTLHYPPGVSGILAGVPLCGEAEANAGTCGAGSKIGETIVSVGLGNDPFSVTGGKVYLTGSYEGAPFGLSIVNPAKAGPFDLQEGRPVVVRAKIEVDPHTAALTVTTNPAGSPYSIPTIIDGIPLQIKHVNVLITGSGGHANNFTFNPTNCDPMAVTGAVESSEKAGSPVSDPFQVTNCAALKFTPKFSVSTSGKTSKANGASLTAKVSEPAGALGTQANIARVKVDLPKQLPSRLTTLQKACTNAQFELNPAGCPAASKIGYAKVTTPLLPVPLEGPAIFVSHGGEAFPSLTMVLQGYGVTIDLVGTTNISKAGITSTTFKTVPDVPFDTFQLTLPEGRYSALAANVPNKDHYSLCGQRLAMPTEFLAQNGAKINESTPVSVSGCAKAKALTRSQKLKKALRACRREKGKARRVACEKATRKAYGPVEKAKKGEAKK